MVVHKQQVRTHPETKHLLNGAVETRCDVKIKKGVEATLSWKRVTCEKCLRTRVNKRLKD